MAKPLVIVESPAKAKTLGRFLGTKYRVQASFGHRLADLDTLIRASQLLQATGLAYAVEADRRRFPRCSMVLPWQLNESYPNAFATSCVDHRGDPRPQAVPLGVQRGAGVGEISGCGHPSILPRGAARRSARPAESVGYRRAPCSRNSFT